MSKVTGFSVRPYGNRWMWILYIDGCGVHKGNADHQLSALFFGCLEWLKHDKKRKKHDT